MSAAAFAYILILRNPPNAAELVSLLAEERRTEVQSILDKIQAQTLEQVVTQLKELRSNEIQCQREKVDRRIGSRAERIAPKLHAWLTNPF